MVIIEMFPDFVSGGLAQGFGASPREETGEGRDSDLSGAADRFSR